MLGTLFFKARADYNAKSRLKVSLSGGLPRRIKPAIRLYEPFAVKHQIQGIEISHAQGRSITLSIVRYVVKGLVAAFLTI